jgi:hypothetical protein
MSVAPLSIQRRVKNALSAMVRTVWRANAAGSVENRQIRRRSQQIVVAPLGTLWKTSAMKTQLAWVPLCAMLIGCNKAEPPAAAAHASPPPFNTQQTTQQLMAWIIDPTADVIWNSVGTTISEKGTEEHQPRTDEEWATMRNAAAVLIESGNLLMLDARAVDKDQWIAAARGMSDAAARVLETAETKDVEAYFDAGGALYEACVACHSKYVIEPPESG